MGYLEGILQPGETIRHVSRLHWVIYLRGMLLCLLGAVALGYLLSRGSLEHTGLAIALLIAIALVVLAGLASLFSAWFRRWTTEVAATDRRVIFKRGFIRRHTVEMNMDKIESVDVDQSILGRILDYGTVTVRGTGASIEPLPLIASPVAFRNCVTAG